jgi:hypothetical protein
MRRTCQILLQDCGCSTVKLVLVSFTWTWMPCVQPSHTIYGREPPPWSKLEGVRISVKNNFANVRTFVKSLQK